MNKNIFLRYYQVPKENDAIKFILHLRKLIISNYCSRKLFDCLSKSYTICISAFYNNAKNLQFDLIIIRKLLISGFKLVFQLIMIN